MAFMKASDPHNFRINKTQNATPNIFPHIELLGYVNVKALNRFNSLHVSMSAQWPHWISPYSGVTTLSHVTSKQSTENPVVRIIRLRKNCNRLHRIQNGRHYNFLFHSFIGNGLSGGKNLLENLPFQRQEVQTYPHLITAPKYFSLPRLHYWQRDDSWGESFITFKKIAQFASFLDR